MTEVKDIMSTRVIFAKPNDKIEDVCNSLINYKLSGLPVVGRAKKLVGYISEKDIIASYSKKQKRNVVKDVMNKKVYSIEDDLAVDKVAKIFAKKNYRRLPVVKSGKLVGIVSRKEIIGKIVEHYY